MKTEKNILKAEAAKPRGLLCDRFDGKTIHPTLKIALDTFGAYAQTVAAIEELSELQDDNQRLN